jgi:O-antigen/teichoic acid export membrane protein
MSINFKVGLLKHKVVFQNFCWRFLQIFGCEGTGLLMFFIASYFLSPYEFGIYNYLIAFAALIVIFSDFGFSTATSKFVAENSSSKSSIRRVLYSVSIPVFIVAILISLFIIFLGKPIFGDYYFFVLFFIPGLFVGPLIDVFDGIYRGLERFKILALISSFSGFVSLVLSFFLIQHYGILGAIISGIVFDFLFFILLFVYFGKIEFRADKKIIDSILKYSFLVGLSSLSYYLYTRADILVLKYFGFVVEIGYYEIVNKIFNVIVIPFHILGQVVAPMMTKLYYSKKYEDVKSRYLSQIALIFCLGILLAIFFYFLLPFLISIFFPKYYNDIILKLVFVLLLVFPFRIVAAYASHGFLMPTGNVHMSLIVLAVAGPLNVILDFVFIVKFGFLGVVYSTLASFLFANLFFVIWYYLKVRRLSLKV